MDLDTLFQEIFPDHQWSHWPSHAKYELIKLYALQGWAVHQQVSDANTQALQIGLQVLRERETHANRHLH
jgi:hypothetical protein